MHAEGRNHIWAYYTRNLVRPVALSRSKVDAIVGNPPWLNYNQTVSTLRTELERQSRSTYGIWAGGRYATHQDVAGLFFARSVDLYLKDGGVIGMVMPHSALQTGQYTKWRAQSSGRGRRRAARVLAVDFGYKTAWDLERLEPNTFLPVPASVIFARRSGEDGKASPLAGEVERWHGKAGATHPMLATPDRELRLFLAACFSWRRPITLPSFGPDRPSPQTRVEALRTRSRGRVSI